MHTTATSLSPLEAVAQHDVASLLHSIDTSKGTINDFQLLHSPDSLYPLLHYAIQHNSYRCVQELVRKGCSIYHPAGLPHNNDTPLHTACRPYVSATSVTASSSASASTLHHQSNKHQSNLPTLIFLLSMISLDDYFLTNDKGQIPLHIAASTGNVVGLAALYHHYIQKYEKSGHPSFYASSSPLSASNTPSSSANLPTAPNPLPSSSVSGTTVNGLTNSLSVSSVGSEPNVSPDNSEEEGSTGGTYTPNNAITKPSSLTSTISSNPLLPSATKSYSISSFINYKDTAGRTPLMLAILNNQTIAVYWLIRHGAYIEDKDTYQSSPLHYAVNKGNVRIVEALLEAIMIPSSSTVSTPSNINTLDSQSVPYRVLFQCHDNQGRTPVQSAYQTLLDSKGLQSVSNARKIYYMIRYHMAKFQIYYRMERMWNRLSSSSLSSSTSSLSAVPSPLLLNNANRSYPLPTSFLSTLVLLIRAALYNPYESVVGAILGLYLHLETNIASYIWPVYSTWIWWIATAHVGPALLFVADDDTIGNIPGLSFSAWSPAASAWLHGIAFCFLICSSLGSLAYMRTHHLRKYDYLINNNEIKYKAYENNYNSQRPEQSTFSVWKDSGIPHDTESQQLRKNFQQGLEIGIDQGITKAGYCVTCDIVRLPRSKHCAHCNNCVRSFDHCCNWVNGDIGEYNHGSFLLFVLTASLTSLAWLFMLAMYVRYVPAGYTVNKLRELAASSSVVSRSNLDTIEVDLEPELGIPKLYPYHFGLFAHIKEAPVWMILALQPVWMFAFGLIILWHQYRVISHGLTTNELLHRSHYNYLTDPQTGRYKNPYNEGNSLKNCSSFWKRSWPFPSVEEIQNHYVYRWLFGIRNKSLDSPSPRNHYNDDDHEAFPFSSGNSSNPNTTSCTTSSNGINSNGVRSRNPKIFSPSASSLSNSTPNEEAISNDNSTATTSLSGSYSLSDMSGSNGLYLPVSHNHRNGSTTNSSSTNNNNTLVNGSERKTNYLGLVWSTVGYVSGYTRTGLHYVRKTSEEIKQTLRPL